MGRLDGIGDRARSTSEPDDSPQTAARIVGIDRVGVALRHEVPVWSHGHAEPELELRFRDTSFVKMVLSSLEDAHGLGCAP